MAQTIAKLPVELQTQGLTARHRAETKLFVCCDGSQSAFQWWRGRCWGSGGPLNISACRRNLGGNKFGIPGSLRGSSWVPNIERDAEEHPNEQWVLRTSLTLDSHTAALAASLSKTTTRVDHSIMLSGATPLTTCCNIPNRDPYPCYCEAMLVSLRSPAFQSDNSYILKCPKATTNKWVALGEQDIAKTSPDLSIIEPYQLFSWHGISRPRERVRDSSHRHSVWKLVWTPKSSRCSVMRRVCNPSASMRISKQGAGATGRQNMTSACLFGAHVLVIVSLFSRCGESTQRHACTLILPRRISSVWWAPEPRSWGSRRFRYHLLVVIIDIHRLGKFGHPAGNRQLSVRG